MQYVIYAWLGLGFSLTVLYPAAVIYVCWHRHFGKGSNR